jgi:nucleoside-diphosphate-sugar epimerase
MKNVLVTGGAGYVGAVLVQKLLNAGHNVRILDLFLYANESIFPSKSIETDQLTFVKGDLRGKETVKRALDGIETVIHLAGVSNDPSSDLDPELTRKVNIDGTQKMIDMALASGVERFINASSSSVYGIKEEANVSEELSLEPLTIYSESKAAIENYLRHNRGKMTAVSIRSATVCGYSPRLRLDLTVNILTHHAVTRNKITVFGGVQKRPNIHIGDISDLYLQLVGTPKHLIDGQEFNACGANHTVMELAELVKETVAPTAAIEVVSTNDLRSYHISADKIKKVLGFIPKRSIADAITDVARAFREKLVPNPEADCYYNVKTMKRVLAAA